MILSGNNTYAGGTTIGQGTLQLGDGGADNGSVSGNITDNAALVFANPNPQTYSGAISSSGSLTKTGNGILTLSGANSFSGNTTMSRNPEYRQSKRLAEQHAQLRRRLGHLRQRHHCRHLRRPRRQLKLSLTNLGSSTVTLTVGGNGASTTDSGAISGLGSLYKTGSGTLILSNSGSSYSGTTTVAQGTLNLYNNSNPFTLPSTVSLSGGAVTFSNGNQFKFGGLAGSGNMLMTTNDTANGVLLTITGSGSTTYSGVLSDTTSGSYHATLIQNSASGTGSLTLSGQSTLSGAGQQPGSVELWAGQLVAGASSTGAAGSVTSGPFGKGIIDLCGGTLTSNGNYTIANALQFGTSGSGSVTLGDTTANTLALSGAGTLKQSMTLTTPGSGVTLSGGIGGSGYGITKSGAGTLTLSGANTYSGGTTLSQGTLNINNATALGTGMFTIAGSTTINNTSGGSITLSNNNAQAWNGSFTFTGSSAPEPRHGRRNLRRQRHLDHKREHPRRRRRHQRQRRWPHRRPAPAR